MWEAPLWTRNCLPDPGGSPRQPHPLEYGGGWGLQRILVPPCPRLSQHSAQNRPPLGLFCLIPSGKALASRKCSGRGAPADLNIPGVSTRGPRPTFGVVVADILSATPGRAARDSARVRLGSCSQLPEFSCVPSACAWQPKREVSGGPRSQGHPDLPHLVPAVQALPQLDVSCLLEYVTPTRGFWRSQGTDLFLSTVDL